MMNIFITGGTGFLGKFVVRKLLDEGHAVQCLMRPSSDVDSLLESIPAEIRSRLQFVHGQLNRLTADVLEGCDAVCHVAAAMKGAAAALFADNVIGIRRLLKMTHAAGVARVVLVSSLGVYGTSGLRPNSVLDESCPLDEQPHLRDPYTYSKLAGELIAWEEFRAGRCPLVVVRPGVIYGAGRDPLSSRVGISVGRLLVRMGGRQLLPYVNVEACAAGIVLAVTSPGIEGEAFNLLDDELMTARAFLKMYRRVRRDLHVVPVPHWAIGSLSRLNVWYHKRSLGQLPAVLTPYKSNAAWKPLKYSTQKAQTKLGWVPHRRTQDGIQELLRSTETEAGGEPVKNSKNGTTPDVAGPHFAPAGRAHSTGGLKILCLTSIFPNRLQPNKGIYNWRHFSQLQKQADVRVISPIAWTDDWRARRNGNSRLVSDRWQDWNGVEVVYPRYLYTPGCLRGSYGSFLKMSIGRTFRSAVAEFKPDLIYACWAYPDGWTAWKLAREAGLPAAVKVHGSDLLLLDHDPGRKRRTMEMLREVDAISSVSEDLRNCAVRLGAPSDRAHLIYEGTDRDLFCPGDRQAARRALGLPPTGLRLLFVGNLLPVKAVHILIDACAELRASGLIFEADLVGEGPEYAELQQQIKRLGLSGFVHLRGRMLQDALPDWYRAADLVVLSSLSEGVPNVLVEAAACGTPFVATNVGGISEIVHLSSGELVRPGDSAALARAIDSKLKNAAEAAASVNLAAIPSTADCAEATLQLFDELLADGRCAAARTDEVAQRVLSSP